MDFKILLSKMYKIPEGKSPRDLAWIINERCQLFQRKVIQSRFKVIVENMEVEIIRLGDYTQRPYGSLRKDSLFFRPR